MNIFVNVDRKLKSDIHITINIYFSNKRLVTSSNLEILENKYALKQIIKESTRVTDTSSKCIDLLYTDMLNIIDSGVINHNISDHLPIYLVRTKSRNKVKKNNVEGRSYLRYDSEMFTRPMDWSQFDTVTNPTALWDYFCTNVIKTLDIMCPIKQLKVVDNKPEWLTHELLVKMRQRDKAFRKAKLTKRQADWELARTLRNSWEWLLRHLNPM